MYLSKSYIQVKEADRALLDAAVNDFYARQRGEVVPEREAPKTWSKPGKKPAPVFKSRVRPADLAKQSACRAKRDKLAPKVRELLATGISVSSAAREVGVTAVTLRKIAHENNIALRPDTSSREHTLSMIAGRKSRSRTAEALRAKTAPRVRELAEQGFTLKGIAEKLGSTAKWIARIAQEHQITPAQ